MDPLGNAMDGETARGRSEKGPPRRAPSREIRIFGSGYRVLLQSNKQLACRGLGGQGEAWPSLSWGINV